MVIDKIGLDLVEELSKGPWTDAKVMSLKEEISFNREYTEKFRNVQLRLIPNVALADALDGFVSSLDPSKVGKLKDPILKGSYFVDALVDLFKNDYLPSVEHPEDSVFLGEEKIHATRFKNIISNLIHENGVDDYLKEQWGEATDLKLVNEHYCHLLLNNEEELYNNIKKQAKKAKWSPTWAIIENFKNYVNKGKDISDRLKFFELFDNQSARDTYVWEDRKEVLKKYLEEKLGKYFSAISDFIQFDKLEELLMAKYKVHFTGEDGRKGRDFIMGYTFDGNETFEKWSLRMSLEYIDQTFEYTVIGVLSIRPLEKSINKKKLDYYELSNKIIDLFHDLQIEGYVRKELELDDKIDLEVVYRNYCRLIQNGGLGNIKANNTVVAVVLHFVDTYVSKAKTCKDRDKLFYLLGNQQKRDKYLWTDREKGFKSRVQKNLREVFGAWYLKTSKKDCETVIKDSKSFFTGDEGLRTLQGYSFGEKEKLETWLRKELGKKIDERCKKYIDDNLVRKLRDYYLSKEENSRVRFQRMNKLAQDYILSDELDEEVRRSWDMQPGEDTTLIYEHYIYTLVNGSRQSFKNVLNEFKSKEVGPKDCFRNDFMSYLNDGRCYVDKEKEYKMMLDKENRKIFLDFLKMNKNTLKKCLYGKKANYDKKIKSQVRDVYSHLVFTGKTNDKGQLKARKQKKDEAVNQLHDDLRLFLTDDAGWAFVRNYSFKEKFEKWRDNVIDNFIEAKPRIDLLIKERDGHILRSYLENENEFLTCLVKLYNDFTRLGSSSVSLRERGVPSKDKQSSFRRPRVSVDEILVNGFNDFLRGDIENFITYIYGLKRDGSFVKPNEEWGCEKQFENFRFESKLSSFMYDVCYNYYMGLIKIEFPSQTKNSRKDAIMNILAAVFEKTPLKELIRKSNKERILNYYLDLAKKEFSETNKNMDQSIDLPKDDEIRRILKKFLQEPRVSPKNENENLEIIIDSALVNYAWRFFDYSRHDFNNVEQMKKSFEGLGNNWKFFDDRIVNIQIDDIKRIDKTMRDEEIKVLPKLIAYCHIQYCWYIKNEYNYEKLMKFYGMNYNLMRRWKSDSDTEFVKKVSSFFEQFEGPEYSELRSMLPALLFVIKDYFIENKERDGLKMTNKGLRLEDLTDAEELADLFKKYSFKSLVDYLEDLTDAEVLAGLLNKYPFKSLVDVLKDGLCKRKNRMINEKRQLSSEKRRAKILTMKKND